MSELFKFFSFDLQRFTAGDAGDVPATDAADESIKTTAKLISDIKTKDGIAALKFDTAAAFAAALEEGAYYWITEATDKITAPSDAKIKAATVTKYTFKFTDNSTKDVYGVAVSTVSDIIDIGAGDVQIPGDTKYTFTGSGHSATVSSSKINAITVAADGGLTLATAPTDAVELTLGTGAKVTATAGFGSSTTIKGVTASVTLPADKAATLSYDGTEYSLTGLTAGTAINANLTLSATDSNKKSGVTFTSSAITGVIFGGTGAAYTGKFTGITAFKYVSGSTTKAVENVDITGVSKGTTATLALAKSATSADAFKLTALTDADVAKFGKSGKQTIVTATAAGSDGAIAFSADGTLNKVTVGASDNFKIADDKKKVDLVVSGVTGGKVDITFTDNTTIKEIAVPTAVTAASIAVGADGANLLGKDVKIAGGTVNVDQAFTYSRADGVDTIELNATDPATVASYGNAKIIKPESTTTEITIGTTDYKFSVEDGGYFYTGGTNVGFVFGETFSKGESITVEAGTAIDLYDGGHTASDKLAVTPTVTGVDEYTIAKTADKTYTLTVEDGAHVELGDTTLDFTIDTKDGTAVVTFDDDGVITAVYSAATDFSYTVTGAPEDGFFTDSAGTGNPIVVESGKFTYTVSSTDGNTLTLTEGTDTVEAYGDATKATKVVPGASGTVTFDTGTATVDGTFTYVNKSGEAYFDVAANGATNGFYFGGVDDELTVTKSELPAGFTLKANSGTDTPLTVTFGGIDNDSKDYTIKMTGEDANAQTFEVSGLVKNAEYNDGQDSPTTYITFGKTANGGKLFFANDGTGAIKCSGVQAAEGDTVLFASDFLTNLASTEEDDDTWFQIDGTPVNITSTAADGLTYDSSDKSLKGIASGDVITNAGDITKVYVVSGLAAGSITFGDASADVPQTFTVTSAASKTAPYFAVDGDKATSFVFDTNGDIITAAANVLSGITLQDGADGKPFSAPTVVDDKGAEITDALTITKVNESIQKEKKNAFTLSGVVETYVVTFDDGLALTLGALDSDGAIYFDTNGALLCITGLVDDGQSVTVANAQGQVLIGSTAAKVEAIEITGAGAWTYQMVDNNGTAVPAIKGLTSGVKVVQSGSVEELWTAPGKDGEFTFGEKAFTIAGATADTTPAGTGVAASVEGGVRFDWDGTNKKVTGIASIDDKTSIKGALNGLKFNDYAGTGTALAITGGDSTTYTLFGGGLSLAGLKSGEEVTATGGISTFITDGEGQFKILSTGMSIADDEQVAFKVAGGALAGIDSLNGSAIGDFSTSGGLSVNSIGVQVTGDDVVEVVGNDTAVTKIAQLGVDSADTEINVSASGVNEFGVDNLGKFDFNGTAFGVSGTNTAETTFNLSASAITGIDAGEFVTGGFSTAAWTINESNKLQVTGDDAVTIVNGASGIGFKGMASGASLAEGTGFTFAQTDGDGTFTFVGGQSFTVSNDKDGVTFLLDGKGQVSAVSGLDGTIVGDLNGVIIKDSDVAISVVGADGTNNTSLTYANGTLSGIKNGDTVYLADSATAIIAGESGTFKFQNGSQSFTTTDTDGLTFAVTSGADGVTVKAITELAAGASLEGAIAGLSVNGKTVDITDSDFGVVGMDGGIASIYKLSDGAVVVDAAGATLASTDEVGTFTFQTSGQSFVTAGDSTVDFTLKDNAVTAIAGLSDGSVLGNFDGLTGVNEQTFEVKNDDEIQVYADADGKLSKIALVSGGASIGEIGSVSQILTDAAGEFAFTVGGQSFTTEGDNNVTFGMSSSKVTSISELAGSVTGNFSGIKVNGATIDIIGDDEITVVGDGTKLTAIQGVDADATINAAGGVSSLAVNIASASGKFTFADNSSPFVIAGDSAVTFVLNTSASAQVTGINDFGDGVAATVTGGLSQVAVNGNSMSVAGDADNIFSYMVDAAGKATLGGVGGEKVTVSGVGGANFVEVTTEGDYNFFGTAYGLSLASGESSVLFGTDGKQVTSVADLEGTLKGDFSAAGFTVNGKEFEIAGDSSVGIVGSGSGVTKIVDLSGGANVKGVGGASVAITDSEGNFTFTNGSFSIAGDADGVTFMLEGDSVVGIKDLNEGATLTGNLDQLNSINGAKLDIKDDDNFGVVGATSGISKVVDLSTPANVVNAGGASQAVANTGETFTFPNGTFTISGDSAATFDLNADSEVTNIGVKAGATVSGPLNGIAINGGESLNVLNDDNFGAVAGDGKLAQLINLSGGANVSEAGGASQFVTDQAGEFTILGTTMEIGGDDNVMFTAGTSGITAIDSLEGTAFGDFSNGIAVNSNDVKVLGDSSIEVTSDGNAVTAIASVTGSDAPTIAAVGGATEIGTDAAGTFTFTTGSASQAFTVGEDDEVTFALDADGVVTGVNALEDGTLGFKDVNDLTVNETELTIESTQNVSLSIADSAVVYVQGVDGEIGGLENATVAATTAMTVNSTDINVQGDDDYKVIVQDGAVVGLTDVSAGATVNVAGVSIAVNESGDFQIGGNDYTFTDENNAFTLTTGDDSQLSGVDELQGNVVIAAPSTQSLSVNGDGIAFASNAEVVTVAAGASGITGVNGLIDKDGVSGDLTAAAIFMGGSSASVSTDGGALTVNDVTYTLLNDDNGITVTGGRVVTDLNENASLFVSEKGKYTVNGNTSDIEVEDTALPIIGLENASDAYIYDPAHILVGKNTPVSEIEQMLGLTTKYPEDPNFGTAENPLDTAGLSTALAQDLDKPLEIFATNDTKEPQDMNLAGTDFSKKVHLYDGPQSVEFNNFGANEAIIERENADGTATGGEKNITLGDGGDAVIMKADAGNGSAVDVTGGAGDDSVVVQGSAPVNFDMSQGGDDKIVTFAKSNARMTLEGYDALTNPNAGIHISERWSSLAAAIVSGLLSFGDGLLNINNTSGDSARIAFAGHTDPIGAVLVNLFDYLGQKLAVAFTNSGGGLADFSAAVEPMLLIGNNDGNKSGGSTLLGGSGDDTAIAGGGDEIDLGLGNNEIVLDPSTTRAGAGIGLTRGRTTIEGFNGTFNLDHGDVIATDLSSANISFRDGNVYIEGDGFYGVIADAKPDGAISYDSALVESADSTDALTTRSGDYTNVLFNNAGVLVKTAIAKEGGVIDVKLDQDQRALNYIGDNSGLTFYDHTGEVFVNLADGTGSIDTADALFSGINSVAAGAGQTTVIGADDNETLIAGTGNDSIWAAGGDNLMRGNTDSGKTGQTSFFVVAEKDGARNTIESFNFVTDDNYTNTNKITADKLDIQIQYDQIQIENGGVAISGNDVVLLVNNRSENKAESVIIKDAVGKDFIVSGDGIIKDVIAQVNVDKLTANKFANCFVATGKNATLTVSNDIDKANIYLDNETPLGSDHEGEIPQFYGDIKVIDATGSNAKLELGGNDLDNTILAGTGDTSLWGGNGGNDLLVAGLGKNSFFYNYGNGNDTIRGAKEGDVIDLTNILLDDIVDADSAIGDDGVKLQFTDGGSLTVEGTAGEYLVGEDTYVVEDGKWSKKA